MSLLTGSKHCGPGRPGRAPASGGGGGGSALSIPLTVERLASGTATTLVSNGVPLLAGQLDPADTATVRVYVGGVEQAVYVEALEGLHSDGSVRSLLVQFQHTLTAGSPLVGELTIEAGATRGTTDISKTTISSQTNLVYPIDSTRAELPQELGCPDGVALPSAVSHLVSWCSAAFGACESVATATARGEPWATYESKYATYSDAYWDFMASMTPDTQSTTTATIFLSVNYYDRALHEFIRFCRGGDVEHYRRACVYGFGWRASYGQPNLYNMGPHQYLPEGQAAYYWLVGDPEARVCVHDTVEYYKGTAWHDKLGSTFDYAGEPRPMGRILLGYTVTHQLGYTDEDWAAKATDAVRRILGSVDVGQTACWEQGATGAWSCEKLCPPEVISNFMQAICADGLLRYIERVNGAQATAAELAIQKVMDRLWTTQWRSTEDPGSFNYYSATCSTFGSATASLDLNLNYAHLFAWLAGQGYGTSYRDHAETLIATVAGTPNDGASGPYWISLTTPSWIGSQQKNWNEANWASWRASGYLAAGGL